MSYQTEPTTMWFDRRLVMRSSPIQGTGTFATEAIQPGELLIFVTGGLVFTEADWREGRVRVDPELYNQELLSDTLRVITPKAFHYYINHACAPNVFDRSRSPNVTQYMAWREIAAGEELTTDYGVFGSVTLEPCTCGAATCRGRVTPNDWRLPELQQRYQGYFPWPIEQRIQQLHGDA